MPRGSHHTPAAAHLPTSAVADDLWANEVVPHLPADLELQARTLGAFRRRRACATAGDLLRAILAFVLITTSLQHLGAWAVCAGIANISAPAWHKRLRQCRGWLLWILTELLTAPPPPPCPLRHRDGRVLLVDATCLGVVGGTGDDWRWHMAYNLRAARLAEVARTDRHGGEHLGRFCFLPGDIVVADNGYGYRRSVATVKPQQADLVMRIRPSTFPFERADGRILDVVAALRRPGDTVREWSGWCTYDGERYQVRLIAKRLSPAATRRAQQRARRNARKHQRQIQPETLMLAGWLLLITTLPAQRWDTAAVLRLYQARWQVELLFKRMKSILRIGTLRAKTARSLEVSLLALLIAWALHETEARWVRQMWTRWAADPDALLSSWTLTTLEVDVLRQQLRGAWGLQRLRSCLPQLQRFLSQRRRRDRPQRETDLRSWLERRPIATSCLREDVEDGWDRDWAA